MKANKLLVAFGVVALGLGAQAAQVSLETGDEGTYSSMTNGAHWSDKAVPTSANTYLVALGTDAPLRTIQGTSAERTDVWPGGALTIGVLGGTAGSLVIQEWGDLATIPSVWQTPKAYAKFQADGMVLANGRMVIDQGPTANQPVARLLGSATVTAPEATPFDVILKEGQSFFEMGFSGAAGTALRFLPSGTKDSEYYRVSPSGASTDFHGKMIFDGVTLSATELKTSAFGSSATYETNAVVLRNGAKIRADFNWTTQPGNYAGTAVVPALQNRGITFEDETTGFRSYEKSTIECRADVYGACLCQLGARNNSREAGGSRLILNGKVGVGGIKLVDLATWGSNVDLPRLVFGPSSSYDAPPRVYGLAGGTIGAMGCERTVRRELTGTASYFESLLDADKTTLGCVALTEDSTFGTGTVYIRVEGYPTAPDKSRYPVLKVPVAVRETLTAAEVVLKTPDWGECPSACEVETADGVHTVYAKFAEGRTTQRFVVPPASVGSGYEDDGAYHTWATAATNLSLAIAAAAKGDTIYVAKGVYDISSTIVLEKDVTVVGLDPVTGVADRGAILDGGYPARTNRIMKLKNAKLNYLTFRNGATRDVDYYSGNAKGGGALNMAGIDFRVTDCDFICNRGVGVDGGAVASHGVNCAYFFTRCRFLGNHADGVGGVGASQYDNNEHWVGYQDCLFASNSVAGSNSGSVTYSSWRGIRFRGCTFLDNTGSSASMISAGSMVLEDCVFDGKDIASGSIGNRCCFNVGGTLVAVTNVVIRNFNASTRALFGSAATRSYISGLVVTNNTVGRISDAYSDGWTSNRCYYRNCLFADNAFSYEAIVFGHLNGIQENCTFARNDFSNKKLLTNVATYYCSNTLVNCVFAQNKNCVSLENFTLSVKPWNSVIVSNTVMQSKVNGAYDSNVWYRNVTVGADYRIRPGSFARDKGLKLDWMAESATDLAGDPRLVNREGVANAADALPDLGCYECQERVPGMLLLVR